jgi:hypothetical protein
VEREDKEEVSAGTTDAPNRHSSATVCPCPLASHLKGWHPLCVRMSAPPNSICQADAIYIPAPQCPHCTVKVVMIATGD